MSSIDRSTPPSVGPVGNASAQGEGQQAHTEQPQTPPVTELRRTRIAAGWRPGTRHLLAVAAVTVLTAILLPFAPVTTERPVVSWPQTPSNPASTALLLSNGTPESLELRFSCTTALRAQAGGGVLLSTLRPDDPTAEKAGLVIRVDAAQISLATGSKHLPLGRADQGSCDITARVDGGGLTVTRDGAQVLHQAVALPSVDGLITDVGANPGASSADLSAQVRVVDIFASAPTSLKWALIIVSALALLSLLAMLFWMDRTTRNAATPQRRHADKPLELARAPLPRQWSGRLLSRLPDLVVLLTLVAWVAIAPMTDDDGYYSAMARNAGHTGFVGNYFQMWNQSFTPFAWLWQALSLWQDLGGDSVVWLRLPALAAGIVTWFALHAYVNRAATSVSAGATRWAGPVLAVSFLAWWLPYCMGVRPETLAAMCAALSMVVVAKAVETRRLSLAALSTGIAGVAVAAHPTGFVALAPLLVAAPTLWRQQRAQHGKTGAMVRTLAVVAAGSPAVIGAFGDGTWHDYVAGQARFQAVETPLNWTNEILRYEYLLSDGPMGSYAKRLPVLLALTLLLWFLVLHVSARVARTPLPWRTSFAALCLTASFLLLWLTPSKWTHHFGSLSAAGPAFITLLFVTGIPAARELVRRGRSAGMLPVVFAASLVPPIALALSGPNVWAYWWGIGMPHAVKAPSVRDVQLGSPAFLLAVFIVVAGATWFWSFRWGRARAVRGFLISAVVVILCLGGTVTYLLGTFGLAAARTLSTYSPGSSNLEDPLGCNASKAVSVYNDRAARPLVLAITPVPKEGSAAFVFGGGYPAGSPPPGGGKDGPVRDVWGSFAGPGRAEEATGTFATGWYTLPPASPDERLVAFLTGRVDDASTLTVEFGRRDGSAVTPLEQRRVDDREDSTAWRAKLLAGPNDRPAGADVVRLVAHDGETNNGGWLAFTAPETQSPVPLTSYISAHAAVTVSWQFALLFPCADQIVINHGIVQPPEYAVTWPVDVLASEVTWQVQRGGLTGSAARLGSLVTPLTFLTGDPGLRWGDVHRFRYAYSTAAYDLSVDHEVVPGWRGAVPDAVSLSLSGVAP